MIQTQLCSIPQVQLSKKKSNRPLDTLYIPLWCMKRFLAFARIHFRNPQKITTKSEMPQDPQVLRDFPLGKFQPPSANPGFDSGAVPSWVVDKAGTCHLRAPLDRPCRTSADCPQPQHENDDTLWQLRYSKILRSVPSKKKCVLLVEHP